MGGKEESGDHAILGLFVFGREHYPASVKGHLIPSEC